MGFLDTIFNAINDLTWGWALVPFLVVLGVFFTVASDFVQFRFFKRMFNVLRAGSETDDPSKISAREALFVSVGGRVGGGNIA
ncbi:sodium:alanine symporter family protein, partial [Salipiger sp. HF18]|nr:sodium:alanine symporter family protein [Salipiger sp. HF18]